MTHLSDIASGFHTTAMFLNTSSLHIMICLHTHLYMPSSSGSLLTAIKFQCCKHLYEYFMWPLCYFTSYKKLS